MTDSSPLLTRRALLRGIGTGGVLVASATVVGCARTAPPGAPPAAPAAPVGTKVVMIIRHGEKPEGDNSLPGITAEGVEDDSSLTQVGWNRARALVNLFDQDQGSIRPGLARPTAIYAARATDEGEGVRTRETVQPLAEKLGITVNTSFGKGDEEDLVASVENEAGPTLISWQHGEIPTIAEAFGSVTPNPPEEWPDKRYDVVWTLTSNGQGWTFNQVPELVLPGDQAKVIS